MESQKTWAEEVRMTSWGQQGRTKGRQTESGRMVPLSGGEKVRNDQVCQVLLIYQTKQGLGLVLGQSGGSLMITLAEGVLLSRLDWVQKSIRWGVDMVTVVNLYHRLSISACHKLEPPRRRQISVEELSRSAWYLGNHCVQHQFMNKLHWTIGRKTSRCLGYILFFPLLTGNEHK